MRRFRSRTEALDHSNLGRMYAHGRADRRHRRKAWIRPSYRINLTGTPASFSFAHRPRLVAQADRMSGSAEAAGGMSERSIAPRGDA